MHSTSYCEDIQKVIKEHDLEELNHKTVLVTGATGLIGSAIIDILLFLKIYCKYSIRIIAAGREKRKIQNRFKRQTELLNIVYYDACNEIQFYEKVDFIIHAAGNAHPALYVEEPVETMISNIMGIYNLLEYARLQDVEHMVFVSSSEVYGKNKKNLPYYEDDYGFVDILNPRACYPSSKRAAETLCIAYWREYGIQTSIVRPGHIYGPTQTETDSRASAQFLRSCVNKTSIIMKSEGTQIRSYCHCLDCASAILLILLKGVSGEAYNISNPDSIVSIRRFAEICAEEAQISLIYENATQTEKAGYNMMENSSLNSEKLLKLGWKGLWGIREGITESIKVLKEGLII